jgi:hypothetical protein
MGGVARDRFWEGVGALKPGQTRRNHLNVLYSLDALKILLRDEERFAWLLGRNGGKSDAEPAPRNSILSELGRIEDEEDILAVADQLCKLKPKAREAIARIRRWRLGKSRPGDAFELGTELAAKLDDYWMRHPDLPTSEVEVALLALLCEVRKADGRYDDEDDDDEEPAD